jgi:hypothetical protein
MHPVTATTAALGLLAMGGAAGAALAGRPDSVGVAATPSRPAPVEVRTEVIHRTVHVVRHIRPKRRTVAPAPAIVPAPAPAPPPRQRVAVAVAPPAAAATRPLRTHSSATGASHGDDGEHEGGGDD